MTDELKDEVKPKVTPKAKLKPKPIEKEEPKKSGDFVLTEKGWEVK